MGADDLITSANPNGWRTPPGFGLTLQIAQTIPFLVKANVWAVWLHDCEGHSTGAKLNPATGKMESWAYLGAPELIRLTAPEMFAALPAYSKMYTDAGIKFGMTLRNQDWQVQGGKVVGGSLSADLFTTLLPKIDYAREHFNATVFYIDSANGSPNQSKSYAQLMLHHPDITLIPEGLDKEGTPYAVQFVNYGNDIRYGTTPEMREFHAGAFSAVRPDMSNPKKTPVAIVANGDKIILPADNPNAPEFQNTIALGLK